MSEGWRRSTRPIRLAVRSKDWRRDAVNDGPCSLDVLIRWLELGNNFKTFQHGDKGKKKRVAAKQVSTWMDNGCPTYRDGDAVRTVPNQL